MTDLATLKQTFELFAGHGADKTTLDAAKFAKLCRDAKIVDKKCTTVDVDLAFKRAVGKTERRMTFEQFQEALIMLAAKKFAGDAHGEIKIKTLVSQTQGPSSNGTTAADQTAIVTKLTDHKQGTHKERFDADGKGVGQGNQVDKTAELSSIVERKSGTSAAQRGPSKKAADSAKTQGRNAAPTAVKPSSKRGPAKA